MYDAPIEVVWEAWTDPDQVAQWWGPRGFTLTTHSKDLRPGGHWHYTMHGPDGTDYPNKTIYHEVKHLAKLVYDHGGYDDRPPLFRVTVLFSSVGDGTKMDMRLIFATPEVTETMRAFIKKAGGDATWDRLAEYLAKAGSDKEQFVINRTFDVSLERMFEMWTNPSHVSRWLPPTGFTMKFIRSDIQPGGGTFFVMTDGNITMHGRARYLEIVKPHRIVYTQQFCDANENISRHPLAPIWPETMLFTVQLSAEEPDRTRVTITCEPFGVTTREELAMFIQAKGGMTQGWTGSFDKLETHWLPTEATGQPQRSVTMPSDRSPDAMEKL